MTHQSHVFCNVFQPDLDVQSSPLLPLILRCLLVAKLPGVVVTSREEFACTAPSQLRLRNELKAGTTLRQPLDVASGQANHRFGSDQLSEELIGGGPGQLRGLWIGTTIENTYYILHKNRYPHISSRNHAEHAQAKASTTSGKKLQNIHLHWRGHYYTKKTHQAIRSMVWAPRHLLRQCLGDMVWHGGSVKDHG